MNTLLNHDKVLTAGGDQFFKTAFFYRGRENDEIAIVDRHN